MRVLLIAYEWPPITAAQSLRWYYLANGLAKLGVAVHVLCPQITAEPPFPSCMHHNIVEHRVWPGPFVGLPQSLMSRGSPASGGLISNGVKTDGPSATNDLLRIIYIRLRRVLDHFIFPDVRTEWYPFARSPMLKVLRQNDFDAVISSHEPGVDLLLGLLAQRKSHLPWIVDLADPLCAPYTPRWRMWLDSWFEGVVLRNASKVILTTDRLFSVLLNRHQAVSKEKFAVIPQGGPKYEIEIGDLQKAPCDLHVVFTGNFYHAFRNPSELAVALKNLNGKNVRLTIAGNNSDFEAQFYGVAGVKFLGPLDHFAALNLQQRADILLNIGNRQGDQLPGKIFEYLVAEKPILHIRGSTEDPTESLLRDHSCAFIADNNANSIASVLGQIVILHRQGVLRTTKESSNVLAAMHGWSTRADKLYEVIKAVVKDRRGA